MGLKSAPTSDRSIPGTLLLFGASVRAAAFSALRAGLKPWCADLFADADLQARAPVWPISSGRYPDGFVEIARTEVAGPWMYTGGLENHPAIVRQITKLRPLWGNDAAVLGLVRSPSNVVSLLRQEGIPCPAVITNAKEFPAAGDWLVKPRYGAGGRGIQRFQGRAMVPGRRKEVYYQEYIAGAPHAAVYVGDGTSARLVGVTRMLVGEPWLHARAFHYCGSVGPVLPDVPFLAALRWLGHVVGNGFGLCGLFGVDFILRGSVPWPVEINPRYTASVEVLEYAHGISALDLHRTACIPSRSTDTIGAASVLSSNLPTWMQRLASDRRRSRHPWPKEARPSSLSVQLPPAREIVGKAILFARAPVVFPHDGPWQSVLRRPPPINEMPDFADIPHPGQRIETGRPILTLFARADSMEACTDVLGQKARDLDRWLYGT